ncbi:MAG: RsmE family RNA methyltransferase [Chloroflexota bacterium]
MTQRSWPARHRFFVSESAINGNIVTFDRERSHQIARVLRIGPNEPVVILANDGLERLVRLTEIHQKACVGTIVEQRNAASEPALSITMYQALLPRERFEQALSKATEIGVSRFVPLRAERCVARIDDREWPGRHERLNAIVREAAEQCERALVPRIDPPVELASALDDARARGPVLVLWERGDQTVSITSLRTLTDDAPRHVSIIVGPEGGFTAEEIATARDLQVQLVWLGPRILRSETAGPVLAALVLFATGEMGLSPKPSKSTPQ